MGITATEARYQSFDTTLRFEIDIRYPVIDAQTGPEILNLINNHLSQAFYQMTDQRGFIATHQSLPEQFYEAQNEWTGILQNSFQIHQCDSLVSIGFTVYRYPMGAAHGITSNYSLHYNLNTGKALDLHDYLKTDLASLQKLKTVINNHLPDRICLGIPTDSNVIDHLENFYFTNDSLIFKFNDMDLCPFALGMTQISLGRMEYSELIKPSVSKNCVEITTVQDEGEIATH